MSREATNFVSGGRNLNRGGCCFDCRFLEKGVSGRSGGWCRHIKNRVPPCPGWPTGFTPSVSITGACDLHERTK